MPDLRQLHFLERLEAEKSEAQATELAQARRALTTAEERLEQLKRYEGGYHDQLSDKLEHAITIDALRGHHRFMQNVASAIRAQELDVARRRAHVDGLARVWHEIERRREAYRLMTENAVRVARLGEDRRLQKTNDEFARRALMRTDVGRF